MNIIVTGAGKGIGFETVKKLAINNNNTVFAISRQIDKLESLKKDNIIPVSLDLEVPESYDILVNLLEKQGVSKISGLINNAGYLVNKTFESLTPEDIRKTFEVNVLSVFFLTQKLLPFMSKNSHILNISSMGGYQGSSKFTGLSAYSASKGALSILTECMAEEFKDRGIKANCLALGAVQTEMLNAAFPGYQAPLSAEEMSVFISDFALNGGKFFNGKILPVSITTP